MHTSNTIGIIQSIRNSLTTGSNSCNDNVSLPTGILRSSSHTSSLRDINASVSIDPLHADRHQLGLELGELTQSFEPSATDTLRLVSASTSNRVSRISDTNSSEGLCNSSIYQSASFSGSKKVIGANGVPSPKYHHLEHKPNNYGASFGVPSPSSSIIDVTDIGRRLSESIAITSKNDANSYELKPISQIKKQ